MWWVRKSESERINVITISKHRMPLNSKAHSLISLFVCTVATSNILFQTEFTGEDFVVSDSSQGSIIPKVAVIGAGAAGSSFVYFLKKGAGTQLDISVYDRNGRIGLIQSNERR
jgi:NAD(P)-binding Rossmann-like domain